MLTGCYDEEPGYGRLDGPVVNAGSGLPPVAIPGGAIRYFVLRFQNCDSGNQKSREGKWRVVPDASNVSDGFHHTIVLDRTTKKAWILRTGGFVSVYQWYGPVDVINPSIENCQLEPTLGPAEGSAKR